jgi:glyoxylate/hydroxypyruvate reductase A
MNAFGSRVSSIPLHTGRGLSRAARDASEAVPALLSWHADDRELWMEGFHRAEPRLLVRDSRTGTPDCIGEARVLFTWRPEPGLVERARSLALVVVLGAGTEAVMANACIAERGVAVARLDYAAQTEGLVDFALVAALAHARDLDLYRRQQADALWRPHPIRRHSQLTVGVLGLGAIGAVVATTLSWAGFNVLGWARTPHTIAGVECCSGSDALDALLLQVDVLVSVLPSNAGTRGLLGNGRLRRLRPGGAFVNLGHGDVVSEEDVLDALDSGALASAWLDVFPHEPLARASRLWTHPRVFVTPHVATRARPEEVAEPVARAAYDFVTGVAGTATPQLRFVTTGSRTTRQSFAQEAA